MPPRYQIPTRLQTEDTVLTIGSLALTMRQSLILFCGGCVALPCWNGLKPLLSGWGIVGFLLHLVLTAIPLLLALVIALTRLRGRYLEHWAIILWRYWHLPKYLIWRTTHFDMPDTHKGGSV
jgi:hypothetical protein